MAAFTAGAAVGSPKNGVSPAPKPQLLRVVGLLSPKACNGSRQEPYVKYWHAGSLGADGEDYRAEYVHVPFPKISTQHHDCP